MKQKLLFLLTALCFGFVSGVKAQDVPTPVYFEDFESANVITDVGTVTGSGELATGSSLFGKYYQNDPACAGGNRKNYLTITTDAFSTLEATDTKETTISFWVNSHKIIQNSFGIWWNEMFAAWTEGGYTQTVGATGYKNDDDKIGAFDVRTNLSTHAMLNGLWYDGDGNHSTLDVAWLNTSKGSALDHNWHHVAYIMSNAMSHITIYVDGEKRNDYDIASIGHAEGFSGETFWDNLSDLTKITLGGLSQRWEDPDSPLGYDEIAIYSSALTSDQINAIISSKQYSYTINAKHGGETLKVIASGVVAPDESVTTVYPQYILNGTTLYEAGKISNKYSKTFTVTENNQVENITYDLSSTSNVFYYTEAEDVIPGETSDLDGASNGKLGGRHKTSSNYTSLVNLPAGTWKIYSRIYVGNTNDHIVNFMVGSDLKHTYTRGANSGWYSDVSGDIVLTEAGTLSVAVDGASNTGLDWVYVQGTPKYEVVGATDCSTGYDVAFCATPTCIRAGEQAHFRIINHNSGTGNSWDNWYLFANASTSTKPHVLDVRPDQWCDGGVTQVNTLESFNYVSDYNGATVDIVISLADAGNGTYTFTSTTTIKKANGTDVSGSKIDTKTGLTQSTLYLYMSLQNSWIEILNQDVRATLGTNGYTTFASPNALDLTKANLPSGLKAYKAQSVNSTSVHFEEFDQTVPANTGILFEGTASETYNIPVVASGDDVSENAFEVNTTGAKFSPAANTKYYALIKNSSPMAFGWFEPNSVAIPANKAYIPVVNGTNARLVISFDEEDPTGINAVEAAELEVDGLKDGKYLIDGKIVLVKNGVKYGANGQKLN